MNASKEEERHRVDRLLDRLGEQQLSLRQHDVSIQDLTDRLKIIEGQGRRESEFLNEIKEVNVVRQLATLTDAMDRLQKQVHVHTREYRKHVGVAEGRMHDMEQRQEDLVEGFGLLEDDLEVVRQETNASLAKLVERIAEQFDEMQASLEAMKRQQEEEVMRAVEEVKETQRDMRRDMEELCVKLNNVSGLEDKISRVEETAASARECIEKTLVPDIDNVASRVKAQEEDMKASQVHIEETMREMHDGLQLKLNALEDHVAAKMDHMMSKFQEYQSYVGRLRYELNSLNEEFQGAQKEIIRRVTDELDCAEQNMNALTDHFHTRTS